MTSQTFSENSNFEMKLSDLQKKFGEEKRAHGETILQLLSAQAQAQTTESKATKARGLVAETTLKLDQAREEIRGLREQAQGAQTLAQEAQAKIADLEARMAQMKVDAQSQVQATIEAQEEVRSLRAQVQELKEAQTKTRESLTQELQDAQDKIASLEAQMAKVRAVAAESEVATDPEPKYQELKAAQAKIENLEVQMAQLKVVEQYQAQSQKLKAAQEKITELEDQMAQEEEQAKEDYRLLTLHSQELLGVLAKSLEENQEKIRDLEAKIQSKPKAPVQVPTKTTWIHAPPPFWLENSYCLKIDSLSRSPAPWFGPQHLRFFEGTHLGLSQSGLKGEDMVLFLDSWLADSHPNLETIVLNDFQSHPTDFDRFQSRLVRNYGGSNWNRSSTFHLERPSDGRIACVKITRDMFVFVV